MSRIGNSPVKVPSKVEVTLTGAVSGILQDAATLHLSSAAIEAECVPKQRVAQQQQRVQAYED